MKKALIIFVRKPELGKVKTRLAETLGDEKALSVYIELLQHTHKIALAADADKFVFYFNESEKNDMWNEIDFNKRKQSGGNLGNKMKDAFSSLFSEGYEKLVIIGSDCFQLTTNIIDSAFNILGENNAVIGPATDGGYYLLGMTKLLPYVFDNKQWSTGNVYTQTVTDFEKEKISYQILSRLSDVDTEEDWLTTKK